MRPSKPIDETIGLDPNDASAWINKGTALNNQGKYNDAITAYDEAIKAYDEIIKVNPNDTSTRIAKDAALILVNVSTLSHAIAWEDRGAALHDQGKLDEAIQAYDKAIEDQTKKCRSLEQQRQNSQIAWSHRRSRCSLC